MNTTQVGALTGDGAEGGEQNAAPPKTVKELIAAWQLSGRQANHLRRKLKEVAQHAQRFRRDLLYLAQQNQLRKTQADDLRARLLSVLERQQPPVEDGSEVYDLPADQETVPAALVHNLLRRLRDSQAILAEYDTLLQFRENQVQELLAMRPSGMGDGNHDFLVEQLRKQLSQARHRVRLLTKELSQAGPTPAVLAPIGDGAEFQERIRQLEALLVQSSSQAGEYQERIRQLEASVGGGDGEKDAQIAQLTGQVQPLRDGVIKLQGALQTAQAKIKELEGRPAAGAAAHSDSEELLEEMAALQDEVGRLQEDVSLLQKENEDLRAQTENQPDPVVLQQFTLKLNELHAELEAERTLRAQAEAGLGELTALREENATLKAGAGDSARSEKLEAAVVDLRAKLQLAASKYQEVKQAMLDKHRELNELKSKTQETEKKSELMVPALEVALNEARQESEKLRVELAAEKKKVAELEARPAAAASAETSAGGESLAEMDTKLKEARRSAVRAQAEAGVKRKEAAKLQEELNAALAKLKAAGIA